MLKAVLVKKDLIEQWDAVFGDRTLHHQQFETLLLKDLLAQKLSLIQAGQLLLIRQGAYDKVGVYYDASAWAYQIMGTINKDTKLCELTNVLPLPGSEHTKVDIYAFFLEELNHSLEEFRRDITNNYLSKILTKTHRNKLTNDEGYRQLEYELAKESIEEYMD